MAYLQLKDITKSFGDAQIIRGVDLEIRKGEFIVFVGPSGCGKSTLLRLIAGLEPTTSGSLLLDGRDITHTPSGKRDLAMVFQSYALYPHMSVYDNMSFALKLAGVGKDEIRRKVDHAAQTLNLTQYLDRTPKELSGGQRQRVAIGRAIVRAPKVFLFDEPLSNLDAALRGNTRVEIHKLHRALGATTIYVTHDQVEAMTLADRVVVLKDGLIEQVGTPLELYDRPANRFVAQFIGMPSMNMVPARSIPQFATQSGGRVPDDGFLGVRPEGLRVHPGHGAGVPGRVELIEALGADTLIHVDVGGIALIARQNERTPLQAGDDVGVELDASVLHLFNREGRTVGAP
ncbi:ABC transporter ATP-binding protein [Variovorax ginsengisoli]|uniref:Multiple sugar transport system ATP-binding protein n=1 Tax=Variovorax ginsengisoli TaxID=363844 RepID=A0ABT9S878_9BURK|nr:sn-glycerol-3-phosphate ABC transporter ATP-binding protein UgpC [Variovorax ginsengisoli]MDP9900553.1 multiple sugar transport system ATP-binding protein [Variovorax ginsengisoli]